MIILDTDKSKLKQMMKTLNEELNNIDLNINKKSNIYRCSIGFNFIGFKYRVEKNKLVVSYNNKTYHRIRRRLKKLKKKDTIKYKKSLASYNGYFKQLNIDVKEVEYKLNTIDVYNNFKSKNNDCLVIVKSGIFYKTFEEDALIIWHLFDYIIKDSQVCFGNNSYDKVISKLRKYNIDFVFVKENDVLISYTNKTNTYSLYNKLAVNAHNKKNQEDELTKKLKSVLALKDCYDEINEYFNEIMVKE